MRNRVLTSLENELGSHCVDILVRPDGSYGFEEFRRDPEDGGLWQCLNRYAQLSFASERDARDAAQRCVPWLPR